ncbi:MAG: aminoacyl-tRNA hydrolase [Firmicutes bacterium]|nr:aminoacyl-tRNA hydrolase [Bacillota bacterium]
MRLIVGLGNPGRSYDKTRHNVGFRCLEQLRSLLGADKPRRNWRSLVSEVRVAGHAVYLLAPQTYMNNSGEAVREAVSFLHLEASELLVLFDDLDLPVGMLRLRQKGSAGGHNGMKSIIAHLGTDGFARIRVGIGRPAPDVAVIDHVLTRFSKAELALAQAAERRAAEAAQAAITEPFVDVMNRYNGSV